MKARHVKLFLFTAVLLCLVLSNTGLGVWETVIPANSFSSFNTYWNQYYPWGQTHNGSAKMETYQVHVQSGVLRIHAQQPGTSGYKYRSGAIHAKSHVNVNSSWPNWEVKGEFQAPYVRGAWPAFWLTGAWGWPPEIDIMEYKGDRNCWQNTYDGGWETKTTYVSNPLSWHEYRAWMTRSGNNVNVHLYIDGSWKVMQTGNNFAGQPMWIIINLQMEGSSGSPGPAEAQMYARNVYVGRGN